MLGVLGVGLYLIGLPVMIILALRHIDKNNLYCDKDTIMLWGVLYGCLTALSCRSIDRTDTTVD